MAKKTKEKTDSQNRTITNNRKARHDYELLETYEAGLVLMGSEIKSIRAGRVNITEGFIQEKDGELWLHGIHISAYKAASHFGHDPTRPRKLLLHRKEINKILTDIREVSYTAVPTRLYLTRGIAKIQLAVARGKKKYDKRQDIAKRDADRRIRRELKNY